MRIPVVLALSFLALVVCPSASGASLEAGIGRSDVTPPTGFPTFGYVRSDSIARGQHTRLFARAIVLRRGGRKVALVTTDLGFTPGGMVVEVVRRVAARGFSERNVIISASHTHTAPSGYANFQSDNFVAPTMGTPTDFRTAGDPQLYGFLVDRVAAAIARADQDLGPAKLGWGSASLYGITQNRSLEAHLANHGLDLAYGKGNLSQDPGGYNHTVSPNVDVMRVDRVAGGRRVPMGAWLDFANHGTVNPYNFTVYSGDHNGPASRIFERAVRREGRVPRGRDVVGAFGNADAGDMTAALLGRGPAFAERVGRAEATAMLRAWRRAGNRLSARPALDLRWTRSCFCGRQVSGGQVATEPFMGFPFFTGSEEGRGPLYEQTGVNHEGDRLPVSVPPQGRKIPTVGPPVSEFPTAVPLAVVRLGSRAIATIPGEMSAEMGRRVRAAVLGALRPAGVERVALTGYANEFIHYLVTPEEYEQQHYEGGSTLFGPYTSNLVRDDLVRVAGAIVSGGAAPAPADFDPRHGFLPDFTPYGSGAARGTVTRQPARVQRLRRATFAWNGGERGMDRPLDRPFVRVERRGGKSYRLPGRRSWRPVANDLGLEILWRVTDDGGRYTAEWQVPRGARPATYRFVITARRYRLTSAPFKVGPSRTLTVRPLGGGRFTLDYPRIEVLKDLTARPARADGGRVTGEGPGGARVVSRRRRGQTFRLPPGTRIPAGAARDRFGNRNARAVTLPR